VGLYCSVKRSYRFRELRKLRKLREKNWGLTEQYWGVGSNPAPQWIEETHQILLLRVPASKSPSARVLVVSDFNYPQISSFFYPLEF